VQREGGAEALAEWCLLSTRILTCEEGRHTHGRRSAACLAACLEKACIREAKTMIKSHTTQLEGAEKTCSIAIIILFFKEICCRSCFTLFTIGLVRMFLILETNMDDCMRSAQSTDVTKKVHTSQINNSKCLHVVGIIFCELRMRSVNAHDKKE
jgi:hypothetical protein